MRDMRVTRDFGGIAFPLAFSPREVDLSSEGGDRVLDTEMQSSVRSIYSIPLNSINSFPSRIKRIL